MRALDRVQVGDRFSVSFQRTLRLPDDGRLYPLPPGLGVLPIHSVRDYRARAPRAWRDDAWFVPMHQREALWLGFDAAPWKPNAVRVGVGGIDAVSGEAWQAPLAAHPQNYIVCPDQPWLDGINAGHGFVRQFVAMPLGLGYTVEGQLTGEERVGGIQILVFEPKPGRFPDSPPPRDMAAAGRARGMRAPVASMGLAAGGRMQQEIYQDPYGLDTWDTDHCAALFVHIVNSEDYARITGRAAPPTPVTARTYTDLGLPWFAYYDETREGIAPSERLSQVKSAGEIDSARTGTEIEDDLPVDVPDRQVETLGKPRLDGADGS